MSWVSRLLLGHDYPTRRAKFSEAGGIAAISFSIVLILSFFKGYELSEAVLSAAAFSIGLALLPVALPLWPLFEE